MLIAMSNPYESPADETNAGLSNSGWWTGKRRVAAFLFVAPIFLAFPIRYWAFNHAGSWFASTSLEPDHRSVVLGFSYLMLMFCITAFAVFPAFLLLWIDGVKPLMTAIFTILSGLLLLPAVILTSILVSCYVKYG